MVPPEKRLKRPPMATQFTTAALHAQPAENSPGGLKVNGGDEETASHR